MVFFFTPISIDYEVQSIVASTFFDSNPLNAPRVLELIFKSIAGYELQFDQIACFNSDNAAYDINLHCSFESSSAGVLPHELYGPVCQLNFELFYKELQNAY